MPLLSGSSPVEAAVDKATNEYNVSEDWQQIMDLCDAIKTGTYSPKDALKCIMKRVQHRVPHVSIQALSLLGACVNNCGKPFHLEICSRDWASEARQIVFKAHPKVSEKLKELIKQWSAEFKDDPQLSLMGKLYNRLQSEGVEFSSKDVQSTGPSAGGTSSKQKDELGFKEDLDLAIALSLQESDTQPKTTPSSLYPSMSAPAASNAPVLQSQSVLKRVKALYDFEAAEDNELSFKAAELIAVLDDSDENWWKGENHRGVGLFPANFVTSDLSEPKPVEKKHVRFIDQVTVQATADARPKPEISEEKLDLCMSMLKNASPTEEDDEEETILGLEMSCREMKPLLQGKIEETDKQKLHLEDIQEKFSQALAMYQSLMKEPIPTAMVVPPSYSSVQPNYSPYAAQGVAGYGHPVAGYGQVPGDASYVQRPPAYDHAIAGNAPSGSVTAMVRPQAGNYPAYSTQGPVHGAGPQQGAVPMGLGPHATPPHPAQQQQQQFSRQQLDAQQPASYYPQPQNGVDPYGNTGQQFSNYGYPSGSAAPQTMYPQAPVYQ